MRHKNGFTLIEVLISITIIGLIFAIGVPSYMMITKSVKNKSYENKVAYVLSKAELWASDTNRTVTNIAHLIEEGYVEADNEAGAYDNPIDDSSMLCYTIRVDFENNQYKAKLTEERYCVYEELEKQTSIIELVKYDGNRVVGENEWSYNNILLRVQFKDTNMQNTFQDSVQSIEWKGNNKTDQVAVNRDFSTKNQYSVEAAQFMNAKYEVTIKLLHEGKTYIYKAYTNVLIDRQKPVIYQDEITVDNFNDWTNSSKATHIVTSDFDGSGIYGYYYSANVINSCSTNKSHYQNLNGKLTFDLSLNQGVYYACVMDRVGNVSDVAKINIVKTDMEAPTLSAITPTALSIKSSFSSFYSRLQVKIHIADNANGSGVNSIRYCITKGNDCDPNNTKLINGSGDIYVDFSESSSMAQKICAIGYDMAGNRSEKKCASFYLDSTAPTNIKTEVKRTNSSYVVNFSAADNESGIYRYELYRGTTTSNQVLVKTFTSAGSHSFAIENGVKKYYLKLVIINKAGIRVEQNFEYINSPTLEDAAKECKIDAWGYCQNGVYVKWLGKLFILMKGDDPKGPIRSVFGIALEQVRISLIDAACCDQGFCHFQYVYLDHSGIWGYGANTMYTKLFKYFDSRVDIKKYLNQENYVITKNLIIEGMGGGQIIPIEDVIHKAYFGIMSMEDAQNMLHLDFFAEHINKYYSPWLEKYYITTQVSSVFTYCNPSDYEDQTDSHYACNNTPTNIQATVVWYAMGEDKVRGSETPAVAGANNAFMTEEKETFMTVPFKKELTFTSGKGTYEDPYVIAER